MKKLFKDISVLMLGGLIAGCQQGDILTEILGQEEGEQQAIGFVGGYIDNPVSTRATVTRLDAHMNSMGVWGWQKTGSDDESLLFNNQAVMYNNEKDKWEYSPVKYWDNKTTYRFFAYAPYESSVTGSNVTFDSDSHVNITGITLNGDNVMYPQAQRGPLNNFSSVDDVDWLIDRTGQCGTHAELGNMVTFNMQHLLAKLTVKMRTSYDNAEVGMTGVRLDSMRIGDFIGAANFKQQLNHTPTQTDDYASEWEINAGAPLYKIESTRNAGIDTEGLYVLESLIIPQEVTGAQYVDIYYSVEYASDDVERFHYRFTLDQVFDKFMGGSNYTLILTVGADVITFDSGVSDWEDEINGTIHV